MATTHTVKQGETFPKIAKTYGFYNWTYIYNHEQNAEFKKKRPNPHVLAPGDQIVIPDKRPGDVSVPTGSTHQFKLKTGVTLLRTALLDSAQKPISGKKYKLAAGEKQYEGVTDSEGVIERNIPDDVEEVTLFLWAEGDPPKRPRVLKLKVGHLDPVDLVTGVQARLKNLGYECGPIDGTVSDKTQEALKAFQKSQGLTEDGQPSDETKAKLREVHGS